MYSITFTKKSLSTNQDGLLIPENEYKMLGVVGTTNNYHQSEHLRYIQIHHSEKNHQLKSTPKNQGKQTEEKRTSLHWNLVRRKNHVQVVQ